MVVAYLVADRQAPLAAGGNFPWGEIQVGTFAVDSAERVYHEVARCQQDQVEGRDGEVVG